MTVITLEQLQEAGYNIAKLTESHPNGLYLVGDFSMGDADGDGHSETSIESFEELDAYLKYFAFLNSLGWNAEIDFRGRRSEVRENKFYELAGEEHRKDYWYDGLTDWWEWDNFGDCPARLEGWTLYFYNNNVKYEVKKG